jgi:ATP-dependent Clp protease protease subunit
MNLEDVGSIYLGTEINEELTEYAMRALLTLNEFKGSVDYIKLYINSDGGDVHSALGIVDLMNAIAVPVHTFAIGKVCSAALFIFMSGEKGHRYVFPNTLFMSHQWYTGFEGKEHEFISFNRANKVSSKQVLDLYKKCTGISERKLKSKLLGPSDVFFNAQDAIELGFADKIIQP